MSVTRQRLDGTDSRQKDNDMKRYIVFLVLLFVLIACVFSFAKAYIPLFYYPLDLQ